jgi:hypothetical protein
MHFSLNPFQPQTEEFHFQTALDQYRGRILDGDNEQIKNLFDLIADRGMSIPYALEKDPVLYENIQSQIGMKWVEIAVKSSIGSQIRQHSFDSVLQNRKFELLKWDLEEGPKTFYSHLESYLSKNGQEGLNRVFEDIETKQFLKGDCKTWIPFVLKLFPDAKEQIQTTFQLEASEGSLETFDKSLVLETFHKSLRMNPIQAPLLIKQFVQNHGLEKLPHLLRDEEIGSLLFEGENYPWIPQVLEDFADCCEMIESIISEKWLVHPNLEQLLKKEATWIDALKEHTKSITPLLFLSAYVRNEEIPYDELDPTFFHKIFMQESYHTILHANEAYPWIPFYLYHYPKNAPLVEAFIAQKWKEDPAFYFLAHSYPDWLEDLEEAIVHLKEPSAFLFFINFIRQSIDLKGFSPERTRKFFRYLPDWLLEKFSKARFWQNKNETFAEVLENLCIRTAARQASFSSLNDEWALVVKNIHPVALIELSSTPQAHPFSSRWLPLMQTYQLQILIPMLEPAPFKTVFNELPIEEHPKALKYATQKQKEFYGNVFAYSFDHDLSSFMSCEIRDEEAITQFVLAKKSSLKALLELYEKEPQNIAQSLLNVEQKLDSLLKKNFDASEVKPTKEFSFANQAAVLPESHKAFPFADLEEGCLTFEDYRPIASDADTFEAMIQSSKETVILTKTSIPKLDLERIKKYS